jgi:hypothetical protein
MSEQRTRSVAQRQQAAEASKLKKKFRHKYTANPL